MAEFAVIESMTRVEMDGLVVRVWRAEGAVQPSYPMTEREVRQAIPRGCWQRAEIVRAIAALPRVNAVEVLGADGCGVVVYTAWP